MDSRDEDRIDGCKKQKLLLAKQSSGLFDEEMNYCGSFVLRFTKTVK